MAGNANSGKKPMFALKEVELEKLLAEYKAAAEAGDFRPSWPDLCARMG